MLTPFRDGEKPAICCAMTAFLKMHGLGNDFIVLDARDPANGIPDVIGAAVATRLADRHFGIGCDQILVIRASAKADIFMQILNSDGSDRCRLRQWHKMRCRSGDARSWIIKAVDRD